MKQRWRLTRSRSIFPIDKKRSRGEACLALLIRQVQSKKGCFVHPFCFEDSCAFEQKENGSNLNRTQIRCRSGPWPRLFAAMGRSYTMIAAHLPSHRKANTHHRPPFQMTPVMLALSGFSANVCHQLVALRTGCSTTALGNDSAGWCADIQHA